MAEHLKFTCELPNGVHARPASHIETLCNQYESVITWHNLRTSEIGNAKSVLSLISTDTLHGDECKIIIEGSDEEQALVDITNFIEKDFLLCDEPLATTEEADGSFEPLPRNLSNLKPSMIRGRSVSSGCGRGKLIQAGGVNFDNFTEFPEPKSQDEEQSALNAGLEKLKHNLILHKQANSTAGAVIDAHLSILRDQEFSDKILHELPGPNGECLGAAKAIIAAAKFFCARLQKSGSAYMRERELDIRDVCFQLLQMIYGTETFHCNNALTEPSVCLANDLTPSQFLELDKSLLKGLVLTHGGSTSHTVILARSFNIPTLVGIDESQLITDLDKPVLVDADLGLVINHITPELERYYLEEQRVTDVLSARYAQYRDQPGATSDGVKLEIAANIAHAVEAGPAFTSGAESIGLFRTEMLYMDRSHAPDEDEQYNIYCQSLEEAGERSIIIRTMDIGGDKPVDYLKIPEENNPFLGYRAIRIYDEYCDLFKTQLRAILRASAHGSLKIMIPMISSLDEILWVKDVLAEVRQELRKEQIPFDEKIPLGIMLEVPSVMFIIDQCCEEIDFFSIGSNDLTQYLMAVDRDNAKVTKNYNSLNPAFLRALDYAVREVHRHGKWIGLCGELGAKGSVLPLLVGMGLDEISMSAPSIPATKERLAKLDSKQCRQLLNKAMACRTPMEVEHLLAQFRMAQNDAPLITTECITLDADLRSKEEVIKTLSDNLFLAGRCRYPNKLADDLWAREDVFSTGLGFGFAIPHTKSEHIEQSTISVAKLAKPILWGEDEAQFVIMLTLNKHAAGDQHMKIFSKLARKIMHADFRENLQNSQSAQEVENLLQAAITE